MPFFILFIFLVTIAIEPPSYAATNSVSQTKLPQLHEVNGFNFPVGTANADDYYKSRGFRKGGHLGEDWVHEGGSGSSFGQPVHNIADGLVVLARDIHVAWGNVVIIRHAYFEEGAIRFVDSLYAHLSRIDVKEGATIKKGEQVGLIGNNHGMYPAHLHFEIHKNLNIGVNHTGFAKDNSNYWIPTDFILKHRILKPQPKTVALPTTHFDIPAPSTRSHTPSSAKKSSRHLTQKTHKKHSHSVKPARAF